MARIRTDVVRVAIAGILAVGAVACGDDDDGDRDQDEAGSSAEAGKDGDSGKGGSSGKGASAGSGGSATKDAGMSSNEALDPQRPPASAAHMQDWLDQGFYKDWVCESEPSAKTDGAAATHIHGAATRVCSNVLLAASVRSGEHELPRGVASVKEVYDSESKLMATVVAVKTDDSSDGGDGWYWYEGQDAEGRGFAECTGCHAAAGSDDDHPGLGDFVYFQNRDETQLPAVGSMQDMQDWLDKGHYNDWHCEDAPSAKNEGAPAIHVHATRNRVCTNDALFNGMQQDDEWPAGVSSVKEIYAGDMVANIAVSVKVATQSAGGNGWYWFEGPNIMDFGDPTCTGCHSAAASDSDHPGAGDYVYFRNE